jgi:site-specific DNA recombinase
MTRHVVAPAAPMRAAIYVRVSSEEQVAGYSLDAQDRATRLYCEANGWQVVREYRDEGRSARTDDLTKRPAFAAMLADAEAGLLDTVVVHKLDRFARNLRVTLETLERLERCRCGFVSISEQMDFTTPIGKVILATLSALGQFYSDNLAFETRKGKAERKAQGRHNGLLPFGITANEDGTPVPDPESYPGLLLAFQRAAAGDSDRTVAEALNAAGYRTSGNRGANLFTKDTVRLILQNRFYLGELPDGDAWVPGAHSAVLAEDLFAAAARTRAANSTGAAKVPRARHRHSLSGLGTCGHCGKRLHILTDRKGQARIYCYHRRQANRCPQPSLPLVTIEDQLAAYLATFRLPEELVAQVVRLYEQATTERDEGERRRREVTNRLARIKELYGWGDLDRAAYVAERDRLESELGTLRPGTDQAAVLTQAAAFLRDLPAAWAAATAEQRNDLARLVFSSVEVRDDRVIAVVPTPDFAPFFVVQGGDDGDGNGPGGAGAVNVEIDQAEATGVAPAETPWPPGAIRIAYAPEQRREIWPLVLPTTPSVQTDARAGLGNQEQP